jgi:hypothetical protein
MLRCVGPRLGGDSKETLNEPCRSYYSSAIQAFHIVIIIE